MQAAGRKQGLRSISCPMNIGIIGSGAIGGWIAARLALAGERISLLARGTTLEALAGGISVTESGREQRAEVTASDRPEVRAMWSKGKRPYTCKSVVAVARGEGMKR